MRYRIMNWALLAMLLAYGPQEAGNMILRGGFVHPEEPVIQQHQFNNTQPAYNYQQEYQRNQLIDQQRKLQDLEFKQNHPEIYGH